MPGPAGPADRGTPDGGVTPAVDGSVLTPPVADPGPVTPATPLLAAHDTLLGLTPPPEPEVRIRDYAGPAAAQWWSVPSEQDMAFTLGQEGFAVVVGPSGTAGKGSFGTNVDGLFARADPAGVVSIVLADAKSFGEPRAVGEATALTDNLLSNVKTLRARTASLAPFPEQAGVLDRLDALRTALESGGGQVERISFVVLGTGGYATGVSNGLQSQFRRLGLVDGAGNPLTLEFRPGVSAADIATQRQVVDSLASTAHPSGNPRSAPGAQVHIVETLGRPLTYAGNPPGALEGANMEDAWVAGLMIVQQLLGFLLGFVPTTAQRDLTRIQEPILATLREHGGGVLLVAVYERSTETILDWEGNDTVTPVWRHWDYQFGPTKEEAFGWYAASMLGPSIGVTWRATLRQYFWFDGHQTSPYDPGT